MLSVSVSSCGSDDEEEKDGIDTSPVTLLVDKSTTVQGKVSNMATDNEFVATVKDNIITGNHVGETIITVNGKHKIPVTVVPFYKIMDDPITDWGTSQSTIKAKQTQGTISKEDADLIRYTNCGDADIVAYMFENGKLNSVGVLISTSKTTSYVNYLKERFAFYPGQLSNYTFVGMDSYSLETARTVVALRVQDANYLMCLYIPASKFNSSSSAKLMSQFNFNE